MSFHCRTAIQALLLVTLIGAASACRCPPAASAASAKAPAATGPAAAPASPAPLLAATFTIDSAVLGETRRINVYTPPEYGARPDVRYPVLYMPDGGLEEDFVHVADAVQAGITWGGVRPMIVVGIENTERRRDMTGPTEVAEDRKIAPRVGGSAAFRAFIRRELMPVVRERYRVTDEKGVMGESLAGLFVVETFFLEPDLFDAYIALSPSVWWNNRSLVRGASERLKSRPTLRARLYMSSANEEDIAAGCRDLASALRADAPAGVTWVYHPMPDEFHDTIYRAASPRALRILFAGQPGPGGA
jgi:predicted alpha/beta superfamily hydrolase